MVSRDILLEDLEYVLQTDLNELEGRLLQDWDFVLRILTGVAAKDELSQRVSGCLVKFFQSQGQELDLILAGLENEIAHCKSACHNLL